MAVGTVLAPLARGRGGEAQCGGARQGDRNRLHGDSPLVAEPLALGGGNIPVPGNCALFEAKIVAAGFLLDFAEALDAVERLHGSEILHERFLCWHAPEWRRAALGGDKDGGRSDLAPK